MEKQLETPATSKVRKPYGSYYLLDLRNMEQSTSFGLSFEEIGRVVGKKMKTIF